jgi:hypothetical protein
LGKRARTIEARRLFGIADVVGDRHLIAVTVGPRLDPVCVSIEQPPDYRIEIPGWASFAKNRADRPNRFRIHHRAGGEWRAIDLSETVENFHFVQPLGDGEWLLARSRADGTGDENAHVYGSHGHRLRSFHAGDGIQDVQATEGGKVWVSFFDEGVFGETELGRSGLVCLDGRGRCLFQFADVVGAGVPDIADCYAMNVVSDGEVWLDYYTDFPLVRLVGGKVEGIWRNIPVKGSSGFAVAGDTALFVGGYKNRDHLVLVRPGKARGQKFIPTDVDGRPLGRFSASGRGDRLFLRTVDALYAVDVPGTRDG